MTSVADELKKFVDKREKDLEFVDPKGELMLGVNYGPECTEFEDAISLCRNYATKANYNKSNMFSSMSFHQMANRTKLINTFNRRDSEFPGLEEVKGDSHRNDANENTELMTSNKPN